jgi:hypothetical protein
MLIGIKKGWVFEQWDVEGAYLNADLPKTPSFNTVFHRLH